MPKPWMIYGANGYTGELIAREAVSGKPWRKRHFSRIFKDTSDAAGIVDLTFHDLRGTAVTMLFEAECTEGQIASISPEA